MLNIIHTFQPDAILFSWGLFTVYWYGLMIVLGITVALFISNLLNKFYGLSNNQLLDTSFYLIVFGIFGARLYDVFLELPHYLNNPLQILKIWEGGLAIHGAIITGLAVLYFSAKHYKVSFWRLSSLFVPGLAIGQAIGRWGNYFNQELFGKPTIQPWGIPISIENRPWQYLNENYFHPTFLYESVGCLLIGILLFILNFYFIQKAKLTEKFFIWSTVLYMVLYSILRFGLETIRIDKAPVFLGWRWPQIVSLLIIISFFHLFNKTYVRLKKGHS